MRKRRVFYYLKFDRLPVDFNPRLGAPADRLGLLHFSIGSFTRRTLP
jgi:hypothetical protein